MGNYKDLKVWQKAHLNTLNIYRLTKLFPTEELYGLTSQIRRAIVSVELNIVEGQSRKTNKDFARFLYISRGSNQEVHCLLNLAFDLQMIRKEDFVQLTQDNNEVNKMLNGLIKSIDK